MTEIRAEVGQVVDAGAPVVAVARDGEKEVAIAVPENEIRHFAVGNKLAARFWADDAIALTGTVREVSGSADQASRTFAVRVSLPDDPRVRLGMTATLSADVPAEGRRDRRAACGALRARRQADRLGRRSGKPDGDAAHRRDAGLCSGRRAHRAMAYRPASSWCRPEPSS